MIERFIPFLFLPAIGLWVLCAINSLCASRHVKRGQMPVVFLDPSVWFSEAQAKWVFDEKGLACMRRARVFLISFLIYCGILAGLLIVVGASLSVVGG